MAKIPLAIFTYSLAHLSHCEKIKFYYTLKGRDQKPGIVFTTNSEQLGKAVLLVPKPGWQKMRDFLTKWNCDYQQRVVFEEVAS